MPRTSLALPLFSSLARLVFFAFLSHPCISRGQSCPPQHQGLPYTHSARATALHELKDGIAVFPGSRYGYVEGLCVRLDDVDLLHAEAVVHQNQLFVPAAFARLVTRQVWVAPPVPADLISIADRWVYAPTDLRAQGTSASDVNQAAPPDISVAQLKIKGRDYLSFADLAQAHGLVVTRLPCGMIYAGTSPLNYPSWSSSTLDCVISLFDTPQKYADPDIATRYVPTLHQQGKWTDHVKATPDQLSLLDGPEEDWPLTPQSEYDLRGFNQKILGSPVPPPGIYPRLLFSPEDIPFLAARVKSTVTGQKSLIEMEQLFRHGWWNPQTSDGAIFAKLASGDLRGLEWDCPPNTAPANVPNLFKGEMPSIYNTHVAYVPACLTSMALYCLLTGDDDRGRQVASAISHYYRMREPLLDKINSLSDTEFGSGYVDQEGAWIALNGSGATEHWRSYGKAAGGGIGNFMNLGLALDFSGKWMSGEEKDAMRRFIAKATYGVRSFGQDGPRRWRDINWVAWDLASNLALMEIEGLPGFDQEAAASQLETVQNFLEWGIDPNGVIYESNGKTPGGLQFLTLSMVEMARRGHNFFGHPHLRKLLAAQVESTSPTGQVIVNSGTQYVPYSRQHLSFQFLDEMKTFFPLAREADHLLQGCRDYPTGNETFMTAADSSGFSPESFTAEVLKRINKLRLPSITYPGFAQGVLYDSDVQPTSRADLHLPLDFDAPRHGSFSSFSDETPQAAWINLLVRPNHYLGAGHHHADAGMFHFSALGVDWFTQSPFSQTYDGKYFDLVQVDHHSEPESMPGIINGYNGRADYLGAQINPLASCSAADLTYAYTYRWMTQVPPLWTPDLASLNWELEPNPAVLKMFAGTDRYKMRPWWPTNNVSNYTPTCRALFNPMRYVYRTAGLIRGDHPYAFVLDDLQKDDQPHLYQWMADLNGGVRQAAVPGLPANEIVLAYRNDDPDLQNSQPPEEVVPQPGEPLLLVSALGISSGNAETPGSMPLMQVEAAPGPPSKSGLPQYYDRLVINQKTLSVDYRILFLPFHAGEKMPVVTFQESTQTGGVAWPDQSDTLAFSLGKEHRTTVQVSRNNQDLLVGR